MGRLSLLIGCGSRRDKIVFPLQDGNKEWDSLITLDINEDHNPDLVWDLENLPLPFADNTFDEIHAYEVLEHTGRQGDYRFFFSQFNDFHRILKPDGYLCGTCPHWEDQWAWGDPSHSRIVSANSLTFLDQTQYTKQVGYTPMSDFRFIYKGDFAIRVAVVQNGKFYFSMQAIKPPRINQLQDMGVIDEQG